MPSCIPLWASSSAAILFPWLVDNGDLVVIELGTLISTSGNRRDCPPRQILMTCMARLLRTRIPGLSCDGPLRKKAESPSFIASSFRHLQHFLVFGQSISLGSGAVGIGRESRKMGFGEAKAGRAHIPPRDIHRLQPFPVILSATSHTHHAANSQVSQTSCAFCTFFHLTLFPVRYCSTAAVDGTMSRGHLCRASHKTKIIRRLHA